MKETIAGGLTRREFNPNEDKDFIYNKMVGWFMVLNATFNNISVISWQSVLLVGETGVHGENHSPFVSH